ncbi:MAG: hypothetical protein V4547_18110 [Bacteroidota bacterium]
MKKLILIALLFAACSKKKEFVCEHAGGIIVDRTDIKLIHDVYYEIKTVDGEVVPMEAHDIDHNYHVGDTIKPCK